MVIGSKALGQQLFAVIELLKGSLRGVLIELEGNDIVRLERIGELAGDNAGIAAVGQLVAAVVSSQISSAPQLGQL